MFSLKLCSPADQRAVLAPHVLIQQAAAKMTKRAEPATKQTRPTISSQVIPGSSAFMTGILGATSFGLSGTATRELCT